jgi:hypothetical protein
VTAARVPAPAGLGSRAFGAQWLTAEQVRPREVPGGGRHSKEGKEGRHRWIEQEQ